MSTNLTGSNEAGRAGLRPRRLDPLTQRRWFVAQQAVMTTRRRVAIRAQELAAMGLEPLPALCQRIGTLLCDSVAILLLRVAES